jgi:hypothetical protein
MNPRHTYITYTDVSKINIENLPTALVQPKYIDAHICSLDSTYKQKETLSRFTSKLHSTFLLGTMLIAIWEIGLYLGDVTE